jgi:hypothetical protein
MIIEEHNHVVGLIDEVVRITDSGGQRPLDQSAGEKAASLLRDGCTHALVVGWVRDGCTMVGTAKKLADGPPLIRTFITNKDVIGLLSNLEQ